MAVSHFDAVADCMQIPWRSLGQSPVIVELDSIYVLACPKTEADAAEASAANDGEVIGRLPPEVGTDTV
jgi:N-terminal region of Chorein or VPS13